MFWTIVAAMLFVFIGLPIITSVGLFCLAAIYEFCIVICSTVCNLLKKLYDFFSWLSCGRLPILLYWIFSHPLKMIVLTGGTMLIGLLLLHFGMWVGMYIFTASGILTYLIGLVWIIKISQKSRQNNGCN